MSRKTLLLNKNIYNTIIDYISKGNYIKTACLAAGIDEHTFYNWQHKAEAYDPDNGTSQDKIYFTFFQSLKKAREENVVANVQNIQDASKKNNQWMASAWLLERTRPDDYAKREPAIQIESKVLIALQDRFQALRDPKVIEGESKLISDGEGDSGGGGE